MKTRKTSRRNLHQHAAGVARPAMQYNSTLERDIDLAYKAWLKRRGLRPLEL